MQTHLLIAHPAHSPQATTEVSAKIGLSGPWLLLRWRIEQSHAVVLPPFAGNRRRDELWRTTCFELFVQAEGEAGYSEFNLSPSEAWAAYDFTSSRQGMRERGMIRPPVVTRRKGRELLIVDAAIALADLPAAATWSFAMTAVIEEQGGSLSYWAQRHGRDWPDFHDPACFTGVLAAPEAP